MSERGGAGGSVADRAHAALESGDVYQGVRCDPRAVCFAAGGEAARLHAPAFFVQHSGRTLRVCQGDGTVTVEMQFLADVELVCEECKGTRFKPSVLEIRYKGMNIHEVLKMTVKEALTSLPGSPKIAGEAGGAGRCRPGLSAAGAVGDDAFGRRSAAREAGGAPGAGRGMAAAKRRRQPSRVLYIFDEPTTGLHFDDVSKLLAAFRKLIDGGGSLLVIEHNLDVIKCADWVIDLGPEGGAAGGEIVAEGTPEQIARNAFSHTGFWLNRIITARREAVSEVVA